MEISGLHKEAYRNPNGCISCRTFGIIDGIDSLYSASKNNGHFLIPDQERGTPSLLAEKLAEALDKRPFSRALFDYEGEFKRIRDIVWHHNSNPEINGNYIHFEKECSRFDEALRRAKLLEEIELWNGL
jgi:hypothetical protein